MPSYYEFTITLNDSPLKLDRKFLLSYQADFQDLHLAIQESCGWMNCHLYWFLSETEDTITAGNPMSDDDSVHELLDNLCAEVQKKCSLPQKTLLEEYFSKKKNCTYIYDFGDNWEHHISCQIVQHHEVFFRKLLDGTGNFPPESCGGIPGFYRCLSLLSGDIKDSDLEIWIDDWSPDNFDFSATKKVFDIYHPGIMKPD